MNILIVESKAKCKTLLKHLGKDEWRVLPTGGHVQRLAVDRKIHPPKEVRKAYWSNRPGELPRPPWYWTMMRLTSARPMPRPGCSRPW